MRVLHTNTNNVCMRVLHGENACTAHEHEQKLTITYTHAHTHNSAAKGDTCWGAAATVRRRLAVRRALTRGAICTTNNPNTHILTSVACRSMPQQQRRPAHLHDFCHGSCDTFYISDKFAVADSPEGSHSSSCQIEGRIPQNGNFSLTLAPAALNTASQPPSLDSHVSRHAALHASAMSMLCACMVLPLERRLDSLLLLRDSGTRIKIII